MKQYEDKSVLQVEDLNGKNKMRIRNMERFVHFIDSKINLREKLHIQRFERVGAATKQEHAQLIKLQLSIWSQSNDFMALWE